MDTLFTPLVMVRSSKKVDKGPFSDDEYDALEATFYELSYKRSVLGADAFAVRRMFVFTN